MVHAKVIQLVVALKSAYSTTDPSKAQPSRTETPSTSNIPNTPKAQPKPSKEQLYTKKNIVQAPIIEAVLIETVQVAYQCRQLRSPHKRRRLGEGIVVGKTLSIIGIIKMR